MSIDTNTGAFSLTHTHKCIDRYGSCAGKKKEGGRDQRRERKRERERCRHTHTNGRTWTEIRLRVVNIDRPHIKERD